MKNGIIATAVCGVFALTMSVLAEDAKPEVKRPTKKVTLEQMYEKKFGGSMVKPGTGTGMTGFVNVGNAVDESTIERVIATIGRQLRHKQKALKIDALAGLPTRQTVKDLRLDVAVFVVANDNFPALLAAPEERWSLVNVAKLGAGLKDDPAGKALFAARCRGEMQRAFCYAAGGGSSQFSNNLMTVTEIEQLDAVNVDTMVFDAVQRCNQYLKSIGVTQPMIISYQKACEQGWAPAPTNDLQRAIWDKVHEMPSKPLVIRPETKKVAE